MHTARPVFLDLAATPGATHDRIITGAASVIAPGH
jgi:hypothetical protein